MCKKKRKVIRDEKWRLNELRRIDARIEARQRRKNAQWRRLLDLLGVEL